MAVCTLKHQTFWPSSPIGILSFALKAIVRKEPSENIIKMIGELEEDVEIDDEYAVLYYENIQKTENILYKRFPDLKKEKH